MQFEIFYSLLTAPRTVSNAYAEVVRAQSCANHVQHIQHLPRATCRITCHVVQRDSSAIKFHRVEIAFILASIYWLNHKPMKEGRKLEYPEKTPGDELQKLILVPSYILVASSIACLACTCVCLCACVHVCICVHMCVCVCI